MFDKVCVRIGGRTIAEIDSCDLFDAVVKQINNEIIFHSEVEGAVISIEGEHFLIDFLSEDFFQCYGTGRKINATIRIFEEKKTK